MLSVRPLSPNLQEMAIKELNENPATLAEDIEHVRKWILQQPHLRSRTDDQFILNFLRLCRFSKQKAKERIDLTYTIKTLVSEFTFNRNPTSQKILDLLDLGIILPLKRTVTPEGPRIVILRVGGFDFNKHTIETLLHVLTFYWEMFSQEDDNLVISGYRVMIDLNGLTMNHAIRGIPFINKYKKLAKPVQKSLMFKPHGYHVISANTIFEMLFNTFKYLVNDKHMSKLRFYHDADLNDLYQDIPVSILPKEYGGEGESIAELTDYWKEQILSHKDMYMEEEQYGTIEHLRPGKAPYIEDINFGADGSFKKLGLD